MIDGADREPSLVDARRDVVSSSSTNARSCSDEQLVDVRAALRVLDEAGVPSVSYIDGAELTIEQRVRVLANWAAPRRGKR